MKYRESKGSVYAEIYLSLLERLAQCMIRTFMIVRWCRPFRCIHIHNTAVVWIICPLVWLPGCALAYDAKASYLTLILGPQCMLSAYCITFYIFVELLKKPITNWQLRRLLMLMKHRYHVKTLSIWPLSDPLAFPVVARMTFELFLCWNISAYK